ncbi:glycosyltransferase family 39 protein, partial [Patescibacteria group bacterium]|nr:glycosyltransferase family 39 protein [Patescibacteria group bacterium]
MPTFSSPTMDEQYHVKLATEINRGVKDTEPYFRAPLYPYLLAKLFDLSGHSFYAVRLFQIFLGSLLPVLIYLLGLRLFNYRIALTSGIIGVIYPTFLYYDNALLITFLITLLSSLLVLHLLRIDRFAPLKFILAGLILGVAGLARPNILMFGPFLFIWIWLYLKDKIGWKKALISYAMIGVTAVLVILPVTIRNYKVSGDPVFIAWQGGYNFYLGNRTGANGWSATMPGIDASWEAGYYQSIAFAEQTERRKLSKSEISEFWYDKALGEISHNLGAYIKLLFQKGALLINGYEIPNNQNIYLAKEYVPILKPLLFFNSIFSFPYGILAPLAIIGLIFSFRERKKFLLVYLILGAYASTLLLFFVCARFRQPLLPFMILLAVFGVTKMIELAKTKKTKQKVFIGFILGLSLFISNIDLLGLNQNRVKAEDYHLIGNAYSRLNNQAAAYREFQKSIEADSTFAQGHINLGVYYTNRSDYAKAEYYFRKGLLYNPNIVEAYLNLGTIYTKQKDYDRAL